MDAILLNVMIPQFRWEFIIPLFLVVSFVEGVVLNVGLKRRWYNNNGFFVSGVMNLISTVAGFFFGAFFASFGYIDTIIIACILSGLLEAVLVTSAYLEKANPLKLFILVILGNAVTYVMLYFASPWLLEW